ncbi:MAG: hypothetical protein B6D41_00330 [Chloroflexi bacterium UTCFX4]|jgi:serine/threonine-protein kinase|nr:MAG: hypothetical protein B6D41_00330 [Chloroflexi bacterium UTCFX4]
MANYLSIGAVLRGRYKILNFIKQGGFAAVYRAQDLTLPLRTVAIKHNFDTAPEVERAFWTEAEILAGLEHISLPRVTDRFEEPGWGKFLVMDYIEGDDLETLVEQHGPLPLVQLFSYFGQIAHALDYLHSRMPPIIHRDVKPANIRIRPDGRAYLVDFGIAKIFVAGQRSQMPAVTAGYSPIEQYGRTGTDARSDIYALGASMYFCGTGHVPPEAPALMSQNAELLPPSRLNLLTSPELERLILQCMMSKPEQRVQSARQVRDWLAHLAAPPPVNPGTIYGRILNAPASARVFLTDGGSQRVAALGAQREYLFQNVSPGTYRLQLDDGQMIQPQVMLASGQTLELNYALPQKKTAFPMWAWFVLGAALVIAAGAFLLSQMPAGVPPPAPTRIAEDTNTPFSTQPPIPTRFVPTAVPQPTAAPVQPTAIPVVPTNTNTPIPIPTNTPLPPTATDTALPTATETLVAFLDQFDNPTTGWPDKYTSSAAFYYGNDGAYHIELNAPKSGEIQIVRNFGEFDNTILQVSGRAADGSPGYGLIFGYQDKANFSYWVINSMEEKWSVWIVEGGVFKPLQNWTVSNAIRPNTQANHLRAEIRGETVDLYLNDQYLGRIRADRAVRGEIGMIVYALDNRALKATFDDFGVERLP